MVERKYVLSSRRVLMLLSHSQLVNGNTAEMLKIVETLLKNSSSHSLSYGARSKVVGGRRGRMIVGFTTTYAIRACHH